MTSQLVREFMTACGAPLPSRRGRVDCARIVDCAGDLVDEQGPSALTAQRLAERMRTKPVLLFRYFETIDAIVEAVAARALGDLIALYDDAVTVRPPREALCALGHVERTYAQARPGRYRLAVQIGERRSPTVSAEKEALLERLAKALEAYGIEGESALRTARAARAAIQGFIVLELAGALGTPFEIDLSYQGLLEVLDRGARSLTPVPQSTIDDVGAWGRRLVGIALPLGSP